MSEHKYTVIYEQSPTGSWGAYVKGLPGSCVATGQTREECERRIQEAIPLHLEAVRQQAAQSQPASPPPAKRRRTGSR